MNRPVITRRRLVAGGAAVIGAASLSAGIVEAVAAEMPCTDPAAPSTFDAAAFLADLKAAGCRVYLALLGTVFRSEDGRPTYFIAPSRGFTAVMAKWWDAMKADPAAHERVAARLAEMRGVEL